MLILDSEDRLLLLKFVDSRRGVSWWATPGGGLREGSDERAFIKEYRWWTLAEVQQSTEEFAPATSRSGSRSCSCTAPPTPLEVGR